MEKTDWSAVRQCCMCAYGLTVERPDKLTQTLCVKDPPRTEAVFVPNQVKNPLTGEMTVDMKCWVETFYPIPPYPCAQWTPKSV